ncbi:hypothetical protein [Streptomyces sp. NPDC059894]
MVNGAAKYAPDTRSYRRITYEAMASRYAAGAAELAVAAICSRLEDLSR